jgi:hypothetical protein
MKRRIRRHLAELRRGHLDFDYENMSRRLGSCRIRSMFTRPRGLMTCHSSYTFTVLREFQMRRYRPHTS